MKRKITTFVLAVQLSFALQGQSIWDMTALNNPNWIPSGILLENNPDFWQMGGTAYNPFHFDGIRDSAGDSDIFLALLTVIL